VSDVLTAKTKVLVIDDTPKFPSPMGNTNPFRTGAFPHHATVVNLSQYCSAASPPTDPLNEEVYSKLHRKAERHEKQMKNGDRERAQHEKYQLERLLDELKGPDWLKTLGISGVTDTEKKRYELKRKLFIRETKALIDKFKWWKEEEKRRKREKEEALAEEAAELEDQQTSESDDGSARSTSADQPAPDSSEIDALASQQLLEEVKSAIVKKKRVSQGFEVFPEPPPLRSFTSFFDKKHLRDAAVEGRQRGRTILAWGVPVPEIEEREFQLPEGYATEEMIKARHRNRRRVRRGESDGGT